MHTIAVIVHTSQVTPKQVNAAILAAAADVLQKQYRRTCQHKAHSLISRRDTQSTFGLRSIPTVNVTGHSLISQGNHICYRRDIAQADQCRHHSVTAYLCLM